MYNRAKYHPHSTDDMKKAMAVFKKWLNIYPKLKKEEDKKYPWLSLKTIAKYEKIAELYGVSEVARGLKKGTRTDKGFLAMCYVSFKINIVYFETLLTVLGL